MGNKRVAFTLFEIIVVISLIAILSAVAVRKLFFSVDTAQIQKLKQQVYLIRSGIQTARHSKILKNEAAYFKSVLDTAAIDTANQKLFSNVLDTPIIAISSTQPKSGSWSKRSSNSYTAWINASRPIYFNYDSTDGSFDCDITQEYCTQLTQ
jgi:type II secretory pathway pseudopilin PulG